MLGNYLDEVRKKAPLIHNITNYVTINDVANMVLACGASPIMSDEPTDIEEITSICQGLNINMGMLNPRKIESMQKAGKKSNELYHKVLLDPVGAGSSSFRTEAALNLIRDIQFDVTDGAESGENDFVYKGFFQKDRFRDCCDWRNRPCK